MADSSLVQTRSKKKKSSSKEKKRKETESSQNVDKELSPPAETESAEKTDSIVTRSTGSPDPNCAICLGKLENKSFTDSCFHMFCFVCLLEWSKVKNECPLCKQTFKSIIHNVRSYEDYDQYHLSVYQNHPPEHPYSRRFRYRTTLTEDRVMSLRNRVIGNPATDPETALQLQSVGVPPSLRFQVSDYTRSGWNRRRQAATSDFRRRIYTNGMQLVGIRGSDNRVREASPEFFTRNPALCHRLVPWLNRELNALLYNQETHVQFVLELIMGLIKRFEIRSEDFFQHISPFIGRHTRQFMKEFEMFAKCPYCMIAYDKKAIYQQVPELISSGSDSDSTNADDDSDVQIVSTEPAPADRYSDYINLPDISAEVQVSSSYNPWASRSLLQSSGWHSPTPGPSWNLDHPTAAASQREFIPRLGRSVRLSASEIDSSVDSPSSPGSDVMVVAYDKPWVDRSPINLSTDSETERRRKEKNKRKKSKRNQSRNAEKSTNVSTERTENLDIEELDAEGPSTSAESSKQKKSKHKTRSWRDKQYNRLSNSRTSRSPSLEPSCSSRGKRKRRHSQDKSDDQQERRRESRSPSIEIIAESTREKRKKHKHKKHKHKHHKSSHKRGSKERGSDTAGVIETEVNNVDVPELVGSTEDSQVVTDGTGTIGSASTSEASGSSRSFIEAVADRSPQLDPVATTANQTPDVPTGAQGVLDLTDVNLEEVDDNVLDDLPEDIDLEVGCPDDSSNFKKHPSGHKRTRENEPSSSSSSFYRPSSFLPSSDALTFSDPLLSHSTAPTFYPNFLDSFRNAYPHHNPHAWYRSHFFPSRLSLPKIVGAFNVPAMSTCQQPTSSSHLFGIDSLLSPLDLRQDRPLVSSSVSSSVDTSSSFRNPRDTTRARSPYLDVVTVDSRKRISRIGNNNRSPRRELVIDVSESDSDSDTISLDLTGVSPSRDVSNPISSKEQIDLTSEKVTATTEQASKEDTEILKQNHILEASPEKAQTSPSQEQSGSSSVDASSDVHNSSDRLQEKVEQVSDIHDELNHEKSYKESFSSDQPVKNETTVINPVSDCESPGDSILNLSNDSTSSRGEIVELCSSNNDNTEITSSPGHDQEPISNLDSKENNDRTDSRLVNTSASELSCEDLAASKNCSFVDIETIEPSCSTNPEILSFTDSVNILSSDSATENSPGNIPSITSENQSTPRSNNQQTSESSDLVEIGDCASVEVPVNLSSVIQKTKSGHLNSSGSELSEKCDSSKSVIVNPAILNINDASSSSVELTSDILSFEGGADKDDNSSSSVELAPDILSLKNATNKPDFSSYLIPSRTGTLPENDCFNNSNSLTSLNNSVSHFPTARSNQPSSSNISSGLCEVPNFWKKRVNKPLNTTDWREDESTNDSEPYISSSVESSEEDQYKL